MAIVSLPPIHQPRAREAYDVSAHEAAADLREKVERISAEVDKTLRYDLSPGFYDLAKIHRVQARLRRLSNACQRQQRVIQKETPSLIHDKAAKRALKEALKILKRTQKLIRFEKSNLECLAPRPYLEDPSPIKRCYIPAAHRDLCLYFAKNKMRDPAATRTIYGHSLRLIEDGSAAFVNKRAYDADSRASLLREIKAYSLLNGSSSHILQMIGGNTSSVKPTLFVEYAEQGPLSSLINSNGFNSSDLYRYVNETASGLAEAHRKGLVHLDLKPLNIFLQKGKIKVADWGTACMKGETPSDCTTFGFQAPELLRGAKADPSMDSWSLGMVILQILAGSPNHYDDETYPMQFFGSVSYVFLASNMTEWDVIELIGILAQDERVKTLDPKGEILAVLLGLLKIDPRERMSMSALLKSSYLKEHSPPAQAQFPLDVAADEESISDAGDPEDLSDSLDIPATLAPRTQEMLRAWQKKIINRS